jgi:WXG100 family type VII secretion target
MHVKIQYEQAEDIEKQFATLSEHVSDLSQRLTSQMGVLQDGGWVGRGADNFYTEMEAQCLPALRKLTDALNASSEGFRRAIDMFREAEQNGANRFKGGIDGAGGTNGGGAGTNPELKGANYVGFLGKVFAGIKKAFPDQITKLVDKVKSFFPKIFKASTAGGGGGLLGKIAKKIPFIPIGLGIYEHFSQPAEQRTWQGLVGQVASGIGQTVINLTPVGWVDIGVQVIGGGVQIGAELFGASPEFVNKVRHITDAVSFDNILDKTFTTMAENPSLILGDKFASAVDGVQSWMALPEDQRTAKNFAVQTISSLLQPNAAMSVSGAEYLAEYQAKYNNQDPQAAINQARTETQAALNTQDKAVDQVVENGINTITDFFSGAMQRFGL